MLLTVLVLAGTFISATVVAGLLIVYQLNQITRVTDSARSIFAADAGIERGLFKMFRCNQFPIPNTSWGPSSGYSSLCVLLATSPPAPGLEPFSNDATYQLDMQPSTSATPGTASSLKSVGRAGKSARALEVTF
jgi:hypothetical protein